MNHETLYVALVVGLFIVPRFLQRYGLPSAIVCVAIGAASGAAFHGLHEDTTVPLLGALGIVTLFLFAGLEVDFEDIRRGRKIIGQYVLIQGVLLVAVSAAAGYGFGLSLRPAVLFALAIVTPSTGFILDSLGAFGLSSEQTFWVKSKAIAFELVALFVLFVFVQSESAAQLLTSASALAVMVLLLPRVFRAFAARILPYAPGSEFAFLIVVALVCAAITRELGVYYLVGAFVVGIVAQRFRRVLPAVASARLLHAVELFASFFIPFYFFKAGLHLSPEYFSWSALGIGLGAAALAIPVRVGLVVLHRRSTLEAGPRMAFRVGAALIPTLVFTLVIADILKDQFALAPHLYGGLIVYAVVNTTLPGFVLRAPPPKFDAPVVSDDTG